MHAGPEKWELIFDARDKFGFEIERPENPSSFTPVPGRYALLRVVGNSHFQTNYCISPGDVFVDLRHYALETKEIDLDQPMLANMGAYLLLNKSLSVVVAP